MFKKLLVTLAGILAAAILLSGCEVIDWLLEEEPSGGDSSYSSVLTPPAENNESDSQSEPEESSSSTESSNYSSTTTSSSSSSKSVSSSSTKSSSSSTPQLDPTDSGYRFRNQSLLTQHYQKHGIDMGFKSAEEYEIAAARVPANPEALHKIEAEDGDDVYYVESTNEFVIVSTDGYIRTYFLPDRGIDYFNRQ